MNNGSIILAIETSQVGSISLMKGSNEIDFWAGDKENSRSQDLLPEISKLLERNDILKKDIGLIAVATGPGSFTGLRVGISIALGLSQALNCPRMGVPTLTAMALTAPEDDLICVVPAGKEQCYWQSFKSSKAKSNIILSGFHELKTELDGNPGKKLVCEFSLLDKLESMSQPVISSAQNLAFLVGLSAMADQSTASNKPHITPLYIREATVRL